MGGDWLHETADYIGKNKGEVAMNDVRKNEVRAISSIRTKIVLFVVAAIILPVVVNLINANVSAKKSITKLAKNYIIEVKNAVYYASYVEYGHRQTPGRFVPVLGKKLKKSWVRGQFMMTRSAMELQQEAPAILQRELAKYLREVFNGK